MTRITPLLALAAVLAAAPPASAAEQTWLLQQRVMVYRQDVEIHTQQQLVDDLVAYFAWADGLKRWIRLPNTNQRDIRAYEEQRLASIVDTDGEGWLPWMPKPSRQWQAPFFDWEVLERRGFCLVGVEGACED